MRLTNLTIVSIIFLMACGQTQREQKEVVQEDITLNEETTEAEESLFILSEEVENFDDWYLNFKNDEKKLYDEIFDDLMVYQGIENQSLLIITGRFDIEEDARKFLESRSKKADFLKLTWKGSEIPEAENAFFVRQEVGDYITWQEKFEEDELRRRANGLFCMGVARDLENPTIIVNYFAVTDKDKALAFINPELTKVIESASVMGQPTLFPVKMVH